MLDLRNKENVSGPIITENSNRTRQLMKSAPRTGNTNNRSPHEPTLNHNLPVWRRADFHSRRATSGYPYDGCEAVCVPAHELRFVKLQTNK